MDVFQKDVRANLFDTPGTDELIEALSSTGFDSPMLKEILSLETQTELAKDWRIGEEFSEVFFKRYFDAIIPYNSVRDAKNPSANMTGTDIVGFLNSPKGMKFLFVEVKTSNQEQCPPSVCYGMTKQIEELIDVNRSISNNLVRYLGHKLKTLGLFIIWQQALKLFLNKQYVVFGSLVRDTPCNEKDLKSRFDFVLNELESTLMVGMVALYIPQKMSAWSDIVIKGGADVH